MTTTDEQTPRSYMSSDDIVARTAAICEEMHIEAVARALDRLRDDIVDKLQEELEGYVLAELRDQTAVDYSLSDQDIDLAEGRWFAMEQTIYSHTVSIVSNMITYYQMQTELF